MSRKPQGSPLAEASPPNRVGFTMREKSRPPANSPGIANDQTAKHCSDSGPGTSHTHCGSPSTNKLGRRVNVPGDDTGLELPSGHLEWGAAVGRLQGERGRESERR